MSARSALVVGAEPHRREGVCVKGRYAVAMPESGRGAEIRFLK
jgi:hypothetical protein